jgi:pimeloyl-ACP methyl ester carboxylesterase
MTEPTNSKPTIVFCHGAWHSVQFFEKVIPLLEPLGYKCITVPLPSVGSSPPVKSLDEDIDVVRTAVIRELDAGRDVMVNAHSATSCQNRDQAYD